jgi:hypothetical protein
MTKIDLKQLENELLHLQRHQKLYRLLKTILGKLGYWQNKPRGNPAKGYRVMKAKVGKKNVQ